MSLYHETADILSASGGNLKTRIFKKKGLKNTPQQVYALALETCKWSSILKEVIEASELLRLERKLSPLLSLLLVHDFLLSKRGIALPASHGLRASIERHKARLNAEFTRARIRRKAGSVEALRQQVATDYLGSTARYPRWVRVNTLRSTLEDQLDSTFKDFTRVYSIGDVVTSSSSSSFSSSSSSAGKLSFYIDEHIPNLLAVSPSFEFTKTEAYSSGAIILQDKASCFPAYLLDPLPQDGDVIDSCAAPGNKTTHVAALVQSRVGVGQGEQQCTTTTTTTTATQQQKIFAFEKDKNRARTLDKMVKLAGASDITRISAGQDFLEVDPDAELYKDVGALLLDPSCSGSGIVGRDVMPTIHLPDLSPSCSNSNSSSNNNNRAKKPGKGGSGSGSDNRKRKRPEDDDDGAAAEKKKKEEEEGEGEGEVLFVDDDGAETTIASEKELGARLEALGSFQLGLLLHALEFPAARKVTYSTCSVHAAENEHVVLKALRSDVARRRGWRVLGRAEQVRGLRDWPVRGLSEACGGGGDGSGSGGDDGDDDDDDDDDGDDGGVADACIRSYQDDGRGVMGFFVAGFVRDVS